MACTPASDHKVITSAAGGTITLACPDGNASIQFYASTLNGVDVTFASTGSTPTLPHGVPALKRVLSEKFTLAPKPQAFLPATPPRRAKIKLPFDVPGVAANKAQVWIVDPVGWMPVPDHDYDAAGRLLCGWITSISSSGTYVVVEVY